MIKNKLIIMPIEGHFEHSADFLRQTALTLSQCNHVIIYDQEHAYFFLKKQQKINYPKYQNVSFYQVKYFLPFRKFRLVEKINRQLSFWLFLQRSKEQKKILWIFYPNYFDLTQIKNKTMISLYDCVDYSENKIKENLLIQNVDYFFVNSQILAKLHQDKTKLPIYLNAQGFLVPNKKKIQQVTLKVNHPTIGFVGGINYRLDFPLLFHLIKNNPQWQFIFYGPIQKYSKQDSIYKTTTWLKKIRANKNVTFGQSKNRYQIYGIIKNFDVTIIPYNSQIIFNQYCYPMKLFEYFYFGKPVVSTNIKELTLPKFKGLIEIANTSKDFARAIQKNLDNKLFIDQLQKKQQMAIENSWKQKIEKISELISFD